MSFFSFFGKKKPTATVAKDRLKIAISSDRENNAYAFMAQMKADIIEVVRKYIDPERVSINKESVGDVDTLEIEIVIPKKS
jgi:cell division topological specificity factor